MALLDYPLDPAADMRAINPDQLQAVTVHGPQHRRNISR